MRYYTAVGSRETPGEFISPMASLSRRLRENGWVFRSGKADGADAIFQMGAQLCMLADFEGKYGEVYKAWPKFNTNDNPFEPFKTESGYSLQPWWDIVVTEKNILDKAEALASTIHPAWDRLSRGAKALHTRNMFQVLGRDLATPSEFLVCYAPVDKHGVPKGGTRSAYVLAQQNNIPCFNFATQSKMEIYGGIKEIMGG